MGEALEKIYLIIFKEVEEEHSRTPFFLAEKKEKRGNVLLRQQDLESKAASIQISDHRPAEGRSSRPQITLNINVQSDSAA